MPLLRAHEIDERDEREGGRQQEDIVQIIVQEQAQDEIGRQTDGQCTLLAVTEREQLRPHLRDQHTDQSGIGPAPAVDRIGESVCQIAEGRDEQQRGVQKELQLKLNEASGAEQEEDAQKRGPRVTEGAVLHLRAGEKAYRQHAAGLDLIERVDHRIKRDPLVRENRQGHGQQDDAAHRDADSAAREHDSDLLETPAELSPGNREVAEQRVHNSHEHDAHDEIEIASGRKADRDDEEPGLFPVAHLFDPADHKREDDQRVEENGLADAGNKHETAEGIDQGSCQASVLMFLLRPAGTAEGVEYQARQVILERDKGIVKNIDIFGGNEHAQEIERIAHAVVSERGEGVRAVTDGKGVGRNRFPVPRDERLQRLAVPAGDEDHRFDVLRVGVMLPHQTLPEKYERGVDNERGGQKEHCKADIMKTSFFRCLCIHCSLHFNRP